MGARAPVQEPDRGDRALSYAAQPDRIPGRYAWRVALEGYPVEPQDIDLGAWWHDVRALHVLHGEYVKYLASKVMNAVHRENPTLDRKDTGGKARTASR